MELLRVIKANQNNPYITYEDLVDQYNVSIYKFCRSLTYSKEDADDLFQETFLKALEQFPKICVSDNPQGFLFSTSLYIWKSWKRKYARRKQLAPTSPLDESIASDVNMEDNLIAQEETRIVRELVESLSDRFRIPIILYYVMEMSVTDIAATLKLPVGTVKSRLFKARKMIQKGLVSIHYEE